jgi:hypothetical protein
MKVYDKDLGAYREWSPEEKLGSAWMETREYPEHELPELWFVDCAATGNTVSKPKKSEEEAWRVLSCLVDLYPEGLAVRKYAPTRAQFEELCRQHRELLGWSRGFTGPARSWKQADQIRSNLVSPVKRRRKR